MLSHLEYYYAHYREPSFKLLLPKLTASLPLRHSLFSTHTILPYRALKPSRVKNLVPWVSVLLPIARAGKVLDTWPSYYILPRAI